MKLTEKERVPTAAQQRILDQMTLGVVLSYSKIYNSVWLLGKPSMTIRKATFDALLKKGLIELGLRGDTTDHYHKVRREMK